MFELHWRSRALFCTVCSGSHTVSSFARPTHTQNPEDKREILCDKKLKTVMGGNAKVTMFNMNRYITDHLLEKLDRSAYTHEEGTAAGGDDGESDDE